MGLPISFDSAPLMLSLFVQELVYVQFDEWWGESEGRKKGNKKVIIKIVILTVIIILLILSMIMITVMLTLGRILTFLMLWHHADGLSAERHNYADYFRSIPKIIQESPGCCTNLSMHVIWRLGWFLILWWWGGGRKLMLEEDTGKETVSRIFLIVNRSP